MRFSSQKSRVVNLLGLAALYLLPSVVSAQVNPTPALPHPGQTWFSTLNGNTAYPCWLSPATVTAKIQAALAVIPAGGTLDMTCYTNPITLTADVFSTVSKQMTVILPPVAVSLNADTTIPANFMLVYHAGSSIGAIGGHTLINNSIAYTFPNGVTVSGNGGNVWDGFKFTKSVTTGPTTGNESVAVLFENNRTAAIDDAAVLTGIEAVARARASGRNLTIRGANIRTYIDDTLGGTAITSVGVDASARASGAVVASPGTAFVGVRAYMAPGFTPGTIANLNNSHAFWAYNEHATNPITNILYGSDGGGGFTNGINLGSTNITTNDFIFSNAMTLAKSGANAWDGLTVTKTIATGPTVGNEGVALFIQNNRTAAIVDQATITAVEGVSRARGAGRELTLRGGHFRTYIDDTVGGTAITSVGIDGSVRASGAVAADPGTAFVGIRSYMAPGFTGPTLANVTNFHAFWAYNESATQAVTNVLYASAAAGGFTNGLNFTGTTLSYEALFSNGMTLAKLGGNAWDGLDLVKSTAAGPTVGNEGVAFRVENNRTDNIVDQATITAIEGVARARAAGRELTIRGANIRTYIDDTLGGTAITSVGIDGSARASGSVAADPGTYFIGIRSYMAPGFTGGTIGNVTSMAFWAYNESASQAVGSVLYASAAAGGFTNGVDLSGTTVANCEFKASNGACIYVGAETTRDAVRAQVGTAGTIGSVYLSSAGKMYLKVANANNTADWERVTTTAVD